MCVRCDIFFISPVGTMVPKYSPFFQWIKGNCVFINIFTGVALIKRNFTQFSHCCLWRKNNYTLSFISECEPAAIVGLFAPMGKYSGANRQIRQPCHSRQPNSVDISARSYIRIVPSTHPAERARSQIPAVRNISNAAFDGSRTYPEAFA